VAKDTPSEVDPCYLKPGEKCQWCNYTKPAKKPVIRILCHQCGQPFIKGQRKRLLRGKWVHVELEGCGL
jgi:ribosomal protein L44E